MPMAAGSDRCVRQPQLLSDEQAFVVLTPYFEAVAEAFQGVHPRTRKVRLDIDSRAHDSPRHYAGCSPLGDRIICAPQLANLLPGSLDEPITPGEETVVAILAHEFGHAVDFLHPGRFVLTDDMELIDTGTGPVPDDVRERRMRQWSVRGDDNVERTADALATTTLGRPILYAGPCLLQSFRGIPRPAGLR
jgi:hypothetical protein